ncbi:hypothetical protein L6452_25346 [Arctium lappa]|uniref:Uncharacterized protein n=1 Tax=Arctium lappa TaxID=4217 RepID=A0ACB9ACN5_ARCLA|nr:hypothetical protein L6452_25346 [Arctium lappa]
MTQTVVRLKREGLHLACGESRRSALLFISSLAPSFLPSPPSDFLFQFLVLIPNFVETTGLLIPMRPAVLRQLPPRSSSHCSSLPVSPSN